MVTPMITQMQVRNSAKANQEQEKKKKKKKKNHYIFLNVCIYFCLQLFFVATGLSLDTRQRKKETKYTLYSSFIFVGTV